VVLGRPSLARHCTADGRLLPLFGPFVRPPALLPRPAAPTRRGGCSPTGWPAVRRIATESLRQVQRQAPGAPLSGRPEEVFRLPGAASLASRPRGDTHHDRHHHHRRPARAGAARVPRMFYDYADSGSWTESTYRANESDFQKIKLRQRVAVNMETAAPPPRWSAST
jgi:hypothetical protein